jgi:hypothetical protein
MVYSISKVRRLLQLLIDDLGPGWEPVITGYHTGGYKAVNGDIEVTELRARFMGNVGYRAWVHDLYADGETPREAVANLLKVAAVEARRLTTLWIKGSHANVQHKP